MLNLLEFYNYAKQEVIKAGYLKEIELVEGRKFEYMNADKFFNEYAFVVLSSGISNKAAMSMFTELMETSKISSIKHEGKRKALEQADVNYTKWFDLLKTCGTVDKKLEYLETLPWIGPITKYHLARNLGIDVAKPDRHLIKIAHHFNYEYRKYPGAKIIIDVQMMCRHISEKTGDRIGTVDLILWRTAQNRPPWKTKTGEIPGW